MDDTDLHFWKENDYRPPAWMMPAQPREIWREVWKPVGGMQCIYRLLGKNGRANHEKHNFRCHPPGADHSSLWRHRETNQLCFITQPYHLDSTELEKMIEFGKTHRLEFYIDPALSWHYPGRTMGIKWTAIRR